MPPAASPSLAQLSEPSKKCVCGRFDLPPCLLHLVPSGRILSALTIETRMKLESIEIKLYNLTANTAELKAIKASLLPDLCVSY